MEPFWRRHTFSFYGVFSKVLALIMNFSPLSNVLVSTTTFEVQKLLRVVHKVYKTPKPSLSKVPKPKVFICLWYLLLGTGSIAQRLQGLSKAFAFCLELLSKRNQTQTSEWPPSSQGSWSFTVSNGDFMVSSKASSLPMMKKYGRTARAARCALLTTIF